MSHAAVTDLEGRNFEAEVLQSDRPVLLDFFSEGCPPCKAFAPVLVALAEQHSDKVRVFSVDAGKAPELAARFNVRSVPTLLFFRDGELKHTHVGLLSIAGMLARLSD